MRVILRKDVKNLGKAGEVKEVKEGYARNFLLPRRLAEELTEGKLKEARQHEEKKEQKSQRDREAASKVKEKLAGLNVVIKARTGEKGKLFGSITVADIAAALKDHGILVDKRKLDLGQPIKTLGVHTVTVKLHSEVNVALDILVEEESVS